MRNSIVWITHATVCWWKVSKSIWVPLLIYLAQLCKLPSTSHITENQARWKFKLRQLGLETLLSCSFSNVISLV